ncbi:MAG: CoA transferase [Alphaproteobacteria bacterium]|nr:CoA transferase [Alphaproteobacteria bacterium]
MIEAPVRNGALKGLKVIDLTMMLAGPFATMLLGDQGATIIKIEPLDGDMTRTVNLASGSGMPYGGYYQSINRNKLSMTVDLKSEAGKDVLRRLVRDADVLVENYRVGVMDRLGLSYESLAKINPRLVYAAVRGFGDPRTGKSPYADWPAFDVIAQAMGGIMGITGPDANTPLKIGPGVGDIVPAMMLTIGILSAVRHASGTGQGQFVDVSMYDAVLALCERIVYQHSYDGAVPGPEGNSHPLLCPFGLFPARDGWVSVACPRDHFWVILTEAMGRPDLGADERYALNAARSARNNEVVGMVSDWTRTLTKHQLAECLGGKIPFGPVNNVADIFADPHTAVREMLPEVEQPGRGTVRIAGTPIRMTRTQGGVARRGALLGEDTDKILRGAGYSAEEIEALRTANAIG